MVPTHTSVCVILGAVFQIHLSHLQYSYNFTNHWSIEISRHLHLQYFLLYDILTWYSSEFCQNWQQGRNSRVQTACQQGFQGIKYLKTHTTHRADDWSGRLKTGKHEQLSPVFCFWASVDSRHLQNGPMLLLSLGGQSQFIMWDVCVCDLWHWEKGGWCQCLGFNPVS